MHFEGRRVAMDTARFKAMEVMPLMAKLDTKTAERLTAAIERLYKEVLELPVSEGYEWGIESPKHSGRWLINTWPFFHPFPLFFSK